MKRYKKITAAIIFLAGILCLSGFYHTKISNGIVSNRTISNRILSNRTNSNTAISNAADGAIGFSQSPKLVQTVSAKEKKAYTYQLEKKQLNGVQSITARLGDADLKLKASKDNHFYLSYYIYCYNSKNPLTYQVKENALQLNAEPYQHALYTYKKGKNTICVNKTKITVFVPKKLFEEITLYAKDADLSLQDFYCKDANIETEFGDIQISGAKSDHGLQLLSKEGDIRVSDLNAVGRLKIKTTYGDIYLKNAKLSNSANITTKDGNIKLSDLYISKKLNAVSTYGDVVFTAKKEQLDRFELTLKTEFGKLSVPDSLKGKKSRYKYYGWKYVKGNSSSGADLNVSTKEGDISLRE